MDEDFAVGGVADAFFCLVGLVNVAHVSKGANPSDGKTDEDPILKTIHVRWTFRAFVQFLLHDMRVVSPSP